MNPPGGGAYPPNSFVPPSSSSSHIGWPSNMGTTSGPGTSAPLRGGVPSATAAPPGAPFMQQAPQQHQPPLVMRTRISPTGITIVSGPAGMEQPPVPSEQQNREHYMALLGMAEFFRKSTPPNIRLVIHCLRAVLQYKIPPAFEARTHLQLGKILFLYSKNDDLVRQHLDKARVLGAHLRAPDHLIKFEAADLLADFFERKGKRYEATCILNDTMRLSRDNPYWHCRLLLKRAVSVFCLLPSPLHVLTFKFFILASVCCGQGRQLGL